MLTARIEAEQVRVVGEPASRAPPVEIVRVEGEVLGWEAAEVRPLREVRLAQDDRTGPTQVGDERRVAPDPHPEQGQGSGRRGHRVVGVDVVLQENRDAVERSPEAPSTSLVVESGRDAERLRFGLDHRAEGRIEARDLAEVCLRQLATAQLAGAHELLKLGYRSLDPRTAWSAWGRSLHDGGADAGQPSSHQRGTRPGGSGQERSAGDRSSPHPAHAGAARDLVSACAIHVASSPCGRAGFASGKARGYAPTGAGDQGSDRAS
jgi:hypothetical protein